MLLHQAHLYQPGFATSKMDASFKLDEGYSEETRSQDGLDSPMRLESVTDETITVPMSAPPSLPPAILALSEAERSGKLCLPYKLEFFYRSAADQPRRICLPCSTDTADIFNSRGCRAIKTFIAHRPRSGSTNRNYLGDFLVSEPIDVASGVESFSIMA